jgi:hypothetical protein
MPRTKALADDEQDTTYQAIDLAPFRPTGEAVELHAYPACRAIMAVSAAMDPDEPILQVELHKRGVVFVGTDKWSYLAAYVPFTDPDDAWNDYPELADDWPDPSDRALSVIPCMDPGSVLVRWAGEYGKAKRAKEQPKERISVQVGIRLDDAQPTLSEDMAPAAVRFAGPETTCTRTRIDEVFVWTPMAMPGWAEPVPSGAWVAVTGRRHAQIGKLGALDPVGVVSTRAKVTKTGGLVIEVATHGYPRIHGHVMGVRPASTEPTD